MVRRSKPLFWLVFVRTSGPTKDLEHLYSIIQINILPTLVSHAKREQNERGTLCRFWFDLGPPQDKLFKRPQAMIQVGNFRLRRELGSLRHHKEFLQVSAVTREYDN